MKHQKYVITGKFPSLNQYIDVERGSRRAAATMKGENTIFVYYAMVNEPKVDLPFPLRASFVWFRPDSATDLDNLSFAQKFILDGMVKAGIIPNDNMKVIAELNHKLKVTPGFYGVEVCFTSLKI